MAWRPYSYVEDEIATPKQNQTKIEIEPCLTPNRIAHCLSPSANNCSKYRRLFVILKTGRQTNKANQQQPIPESDLTITVTELVTSCNRKCNYQVSLKQLITLLDSVYSAPVHHHCKEVPSWRKEI